MLTAGPGPDKDTAGRGVGRFEGAGDALPAMLRLHALPAVLPFLGRFEVAVPVVERAHGSVMPDWMRSIAFSAATAHEGPTQSSPPVQ